MRERSLIGRMKEHWTGAFPRYNVHVWTYGSYEQQQQGVEFEKSQVSQSEKTTKNGGCKSSSLNLGMFHWNSYRSYAWLSLKDVSYSCLIIISMIPNWGLGNMRTGMGPRGRHEDMGIWGYDKWGQEDIGHDTWGHEDMGILICTWGHDTWGHWDLGTWGHWDTTHRNMRTWQMGLMIVITALKYTFRC